MTDRPDRLVEELLTGSPTSRRAFMRRMGTVGFALSGASTLLAACGGIEGEGNNAGEAEGTPTPVAANHPQTEIDQLNISNWPLYIDKKVIRQFEKQTGANVKYSEDINDNEEFFGKIRQPLGQGNSIGRDIIVLTDWMAARMVRLGWLEPIDKDNVPNFSNLQPSLADPQWDPGRNYSLPWQSGMTAIGYNKKKVGGELTSWEQIFDPKFEGRVSLLADAREAVNMILLKNGKRPEDATLDDALAAIEEVDQINRSGQIRRFTGNDYTTDLTKGNLWIAQAYSGDLIQLQADNPDLAFAIPEEGATIWTDNMLMPIEAEHYYAAEKWMDYVYDPEVAATIAAWVNYVTPVVGAKEVLAERDPELADNELIFPSEQTLQNLHPYVNFDETEERQMNEAFQAVIGA